MRPPEVRRADTVTIRHTGTGATSIVTRKAFERRSSKLGWAILDEPEYANEDPASEDGNPDAKAALQAEAVALGVDLDKRWGVKRLEAEIAEARDGAEATE